MEPIEAKVRYVITSTVTKIEHYPHGYYAHFDGSREMLFMGDEPLDFEVGDRIRITIERADDGQTQ